MKRFLYLLIAFVAITLSTCVPAHAQSTAIGTFHRDAAVSFTDDYAGMIVSFAGTVDSLMNDTSKTFTFAGYQGESWYVNPIQYSKKLNAVHGKPYVTTIFQGLLDSANWVNIDTLGVKDSTETVQRGTIDFNNYKCRQYRAIIKAEQNGASTPSNDTDYSLYFLLPRKDN
jgi:hypothetical protein